MLHRFGPWSALFTAAALLSSANSQADPPTITPVEPGASVRPAAAAMLPESDFRRVVRLAKNRVFPAVIYIKCIREGMEAGRKEANEQAGSGVIISADGEAVTNWHVVNKATDIRCLLYDGQALPARLVGSDKDTDLALLKLDVPAGVALPYATLADSRGLEEGEFVMAMGAPWGLSRSVSIGIISCTRRYLPEHSEYSLWLQSDCAISPGNSGGPLVNTAGEVVGINSRGALVGGDMGFAIPSETVRVVLSGIREHGFMNWSWYGLELQPLRDFNRNMYFEGDDGVIVANTAPGSPARTAGLQPRDRIVRINGQGLRARTEEDLPGLRSWLGLLPKDQPVEFELFRGDQTLTLSVTPRAKGQVEGEEYDCRRWDMTVKTINQFDNPSLHFFRQEGVFIFGLRQPGNASVAGLASQDILTKIDGQEVRTLDDVKRLHEAALASATTRSRVVLTVLRKGLQRQVVLDFSRDYSRE